MKKWTKEKIINYIELISKFCVLNCENDGVDALVTLKCDLGHIFTTKFNNFLINVKRKRNGCTECGKLEIGNKLRHSYDYVEQYINQFGYDLISNTYKTKYDKLEIKCPNNHIFLVSFDSFKNNSSRCPICFHENLNKENRLNYNEVNNIIFNLGYKLISSEYINYDTPLEMICGDGHYCKISLNNFIHGHRCKTCFIYRISGENCHLWNGGITPIIKKERQTIQYKQWRKLVFERDNYICQCCGQYGGKLQAHHIENFSSNEELRFDVNNGITLCKECHHPNIKYSFHNIYGTKNNTPAQIEEYIQRYKNGEFQNELQKYNLLNVN